MMSFMIFDVAPIGFVLPILLLVVLPLVAIICIVVAVLIINKRKKKASEAPKIQETLKPEVALANAEEKPSEEAKKHD
jgi:mannose/fructose/N-acetylgalactosamine-specific phosphotransferase system component IIC